MHSDKDSDQGALDLTPLIELRDLSVRGKSSKLQGFESLINLESLSMLYASLADGPGFDFSRHAKLKSLSIDGCASGRLETLPPSIEALHIHGCGVSNTSVGAMLQRLVNLRSLRLTAIYGGFGYPSDPEAITGAGGDFTNQKNLQLLDLGDCDYIQDSLVARIAEQLPRLESLRFADSRLLTGKGWDLQRLSNLKQLELIELPQLDNATIQQLPKSLESRKISGCPTMTGRNWDLASLRNLTNLAIQRCGSLTSIGVRLPPSLETLVVSECVRFQGRELSYSGIEKLEKVSFSECHAFDVDRLFAALPKHAASLRRLNLTGCPNLAPRGWDLSPLKETLRELIYPEGEPSYVGGISEANYRMLQQQLPNTKIIQ